MRIPISRKIFIGFTLMFLMVLALGGIVYTGFNALNTSHINLELLNQFRYRVQKLEALQSQTAVFTPAQSGVIDIEFDKAKELVKKVGEMSLGDDPDLAKRLSGLTEHLDYYRTALYELVEMHSLDKTLHVGNHRILYELSGLIDQEKADKFSILYRLLARIQLVWSDAYHDRDIDALNRIKDDVSRARAAGVNEEIVKRLDQFELKVEKGFFNHIAIKNHKVSLRKTAGRFSSVAADVLMVIEANHIKNLTFNRGVIAITVLLAAAITLLLWKISTNYLQLFVSSTRKAMESIRDGNYEVELLPVADDELGDLSRFLSSVGHDLELGRAMLRDSEAKFRTLVNQAADAMFLHNFEGRLLDVNVQACESLGYSRRELLKMNVWDVDAEFVEKEHRKNCWTKLKPGVPVTLEGVHKRKDGTTFLVEVRLSSLELGNQRAIMGQARDLTERRQAEEKRISLEKQVLHAQKLESLGVLAGGIAHDFNNLLMGVMGNADLALMHLEPDHPVSQHVKMIQKAAMRAADLTGQMLAYSGKGRFVIESVKLERVAEEMVHLLGTIISKKAKLEFHFGDDVPAVDGDATQLRQVFMNLVTNASEALDDKPGTIIVRTGVTELDGEAIAAQTLDEQVDPGSYAYIEVSDDGMGMDAETKRRIFEPFFTTKFTGRGLGLAAVQGIVRGHGGTLSLVSNTGEGTTFTVYLPCPDAVEEETPCPVVTEFNLATYQGNGTILVVDDEDAVLTVAKLALEKFGFNVITAVDGLDGLEKFKENPGKISLVLLDMTMPNLDGVETFKELVKLDPAVKVILSSGYNRKESVEVFQDTPPAGFLHKPYRAEELLREVDKHL